MRGAVARTGLALLCQRGSARRLAKHRLGPWNVQTAGGAATAEQSSSHLGAVAGNEIVHGLLRREAGDGRQDPKGIAAQQDDGFGVRPGARRPGIGNMLNGVRCTRILCQRSAE
jgi:hypothetical protein